MVEPTSSVATILASYAVEKTADVGLAAVFGISERRRRRAAFARAFQVAENAVRGLFPEVATELFTSKSADALRVFVEAISRDPSRRPAFGALAADFFDTHFPGVSAERLESAVEARYRRPVGDVRSALEQFYQSSVEGFAREPVLVHHWDQQTQRQIKEGVDRANEALSELTAIGKGIEASSRLAPEETKRLKAEHSRLRHRSGFLPFDAPSEVLAFASAIERGRFQFADPAAKAESLLFCARILARSKRLDDATRVRALSLACGAATSDLAYDAWLAVANGQAETSLRIARSGATPLAVSIQLSLLRHLEGLPAVAKLVTESSLTSHDLTGSGASAAIEAFIAGGEYARARMFGLELTNDQLEQAPWLHFQLGITRLLEIADPTENGSLLSGVLPSFTGGIMARSHPQWRTLLKEANEEFVAAEAVARACGADHAADQLTELATFSALEHPDLRTDARGIVTRRVADRDSWGRFVHLAVSYNIPFDRAGLRATIDNAARLRQLQQHEVRSAFSIFNEPRDLLRFLTAHRANIEEAVGVLFVALIEVEALAKSGDLGAAKARFERVRAETPPETQKRFESILREGPYTELQGLEQRFADFDQTSDLRMLVAELLEQERWDQAERYVRQLFERSGEGGDLQNYCIVLERQGKDDLAWSAMEAAWSGIEKTIPLWKLRAQIATSVRNLTEARAALEHIPADRFSSQDYRLSTLIALECGRWDQIAELVRTVIARKKFNNPPFLIYLANIAALLDMPDEAMLLAASAAAAGSDDPNILLGAYSIGMKLGREETDDHISDWFQSAVAKSGEAGPIQRKTIKDLLDLAPKWSEREAAISKQWLAGELPMFVAAQTANTSVVDLVLRRALQNKSQSDPRRRGLISAFSGTLNYRKLSGSESVALDLSTILVLEIVGCLQHVLDTFSKLAVPAWTFSALFLAIGELRFHQPSRVKHAKAIRDLVADGLIREFHGVGTRQSLQEEVGPELAAMIEEAEKTGASVIRPAPLHRYGSAMEIEVSFDQLCPTGVDTLAVIGALRQAGHLTEQAATEARTTLAQLDRRWSGIRSIDLSKPIYVDALACDYLEKHNLLRSLSEAARAAGGLIFVEARVVEEASQLVAHDHLTAEALMKLNSIREKLATAYAASRLRIAREMDSDDDDIAETPTGQAILGSLESDVVVVDDRALGRYDFLPGYGGRGIPIINSLSLLETLHSIGRISDAEFRLVRHKLREAGCFFVPIGLDELEYWLAGSSLQENGGLLETLELRTIRESIQRVLMIEAPFLPRERAIFQQWRLSFIIAARKAWHSSEDENLAKARADWCLGVLPDPRDLLHLSSEAPDEVAIDRELAENAMYLSVGGPSYDPQRTFFREWADETVLGPLEAARPRAFEFCLDIVEQMLSSGIKGDLHER